MKSKINFNPQAQFTSFFSRFANYAIMLLLTVVTVVVIASNGTMLAFGVKAWWILLPTGIVFLGNSAILMWTAKYPYKIICYVLDVICLLIFTVFSNGTLISTLYILVLSDFYLHQPRFINNIIMCVVSIVLFMITLIVTEILRGDTLDIARLFANTFNELLLFLLHFVAMNFSVQLYRKNKELRSAIAKLDESNQKLQEAYRELQEVTALEERQRIAKDIHDTAGHSITTVIMQTEAAKLLIESDPVEAKRRIAGANLQAKHALEELRESVHLLSGAEDQQTLKGLLEGIIHDSTDGTDVTVRYEIDDIDLCDSKRRFLCNTLKEGISNGLRHGGATAFWFSLTQEDGRVKFTLLDNGTGMEIASLKEGFGLSGMHRRAESLGGNVWFETEQDEGFEIHLTLPLDGKKGG